jgi:hypothetical protein
LHASITQESICVVVDELESRLVEFGGSVMLSNCKTNSIRKTLTKRSCGDLNTRSIMCFWVTRCDAVNGLMLEIRKISVNLCILTYSECFEIVKRNSITAKVKKSILKHTSVSVAI